MNRQAIEQYAAGAGTPRAWIEGLSREQLLAHPVAGTWSVQELVIHVLDSDLIATHRMRRIVAEEKPLLVGYDETKFAATLFYDKMDAAKAAEMFRLNREMTADLLRLLPDAAFKRQGVHTERGLVALGDFVTLYVDHLKHHETFLRAKRAALGKPL